MTRTNNRLVSLLDRPTARPAVVSVWAAQVSAPTQGNVDTAGRLVQDDRRPVRAVPPTKPLPLGWGSAEERRLMLWGVLGFGVLGLYAVTFVLLGALVWS